MEQNRAAGEVEAILKQVEAVWNRDLAQAEQLATKASRLAEGAGLPWRLDSRLKLTACKARLGEMDEAADLAAKAIEEADDYGDPLRSAQAINLLAAIWLNQGHHARALSLMSEHLHWVGELENTEEDGKLLNNLGVAYERMGDLPQAMTYYLKSLDRKDQKRNARGVAYTSHNIGMVHYLLKNYNEAEEWNNKALERFQQLGDIRGRAPVLNTLGLIKRAKGDIETAQQIHTQALEFARTSKDRRETAESLMHLAFSQRESGTPEEARSSVEEALGLCRKLGDRHQETELLIERAQTEAALGEQHAALATFNKAERLAMNIAAKALRRNISKTRAELLSRSSDYESAYGDLLQFIKLDEELRGAEVEQRIRAITVPLELRAAKAEAEVHRLRAIEAEHLSLVDPLTGLGNRRKFEQQLKQLESSCQQYAVALIDVDHFKNINDQFSHAVGDQVLERLGNILNAQAVSGGVYRMGGEEFIMLFVEQKVNRAYDLCESTRQKIQNANWRQLADSLEVNVSIGLASSDETAVSEEVVALADQRLYQAKAAGRNRVVAV